MGTKKLSLDDLLELDIEREMPSLALLVLLRRITLLRSYINSPVR